LPALKLYSKKTAPKLRCLKELEFKIAITNLIRLGDYKRKEQTSKHRSDYYKFPFVAGFLTNFRNNKEAKKQQIQFSDPTWRAVRPINPFD
jgi:hypothetical protein